MTGWVDRCVDAVVQTEKPSSRLRLRARMEGLLVAWGGGDLGEARVRCVRIGGRRMRQRRRERNGWRQGRERAPDD